MSRAAPLSRAVMAQTRMELALTLRRGETLLITFVIPILLLLFFGSVPLLPTVAGARAIDYLVPGILALAIMSTGMVGLGIATAFERYYGVLKRLGGSPLPRGGLLLAKIGSVVVVEVFQTILVMLIGALVFDWRPGGQPGLAFLVLLLGTITFAAFGLLLAGTLRAEATLAAANGLYLVMLLLGDMVFPLSQLPPWLAGAARYLPATAFASALRASLLPGEPFPGLNLAVLAAWGAVALALAARTFKWE